MKRPTVCVIGAGSSGLPCIKAMRDAGIPVTCFEMSDEVGGNWLFDNPNGINNIYRSLHINTSRTRMEYADFPMPEDYPDFPGHAEIAAYFRTYVDAYGLDRDIEFQTTVTHCERLDDGTWEVTIDETDVRYFDVLFVANGHHWDPRYPDPPFPGEFHGETFHSHAYVDPSDPIDLHDKNVVVLGLGNSAADIASEISRRGITRNTYLCSRRGAWIVPNYVFGKPMDLMPVTNPLFHPRVPWAVRGPILNRFVALMFGDMKQYGLPRPTHPFDAAHPTISSELPVKVGRGDVQYMGNIESFEGDRVAFTNGEERDVDVVIYCTGYNVTFPFFDEEFLSAPDNDLPLFKRVFHPEIPNLAFAGLLQPLGAIMPIAEAQAKWVASYLTGRYRLPTPDAMRATMAAERTAMRRRYVASPRHTMQVDYDDYLWDLARERAAGAARAKRHERRPTIPARAHRYEATKRAVGGQFA